MIYVLLFTNVLWAVLFFLQRGDCHRALELCDETIAAWRKYNAAWDAIYAELSEAIAKRGELSDRMVEIDPADAARYIQWRDTFTPHPRNVDRLKPIDDALRAHAQKAVKR